MSLPTQKLAFEVAVLRDVIAYSGLNAILPLADVAVGVVVLQIAESVL